MKVEKVYVEGPVVIVEIDGGDWIEFPDRREGIFDIRTGGDGGGVWIPTPEEVVEVARKAQDFAKKKGLRYAVEVLEQYI